jgi:hypothetical protein
MSDQHLNAGQLQQIQKQASDALQLAVDRMHLRKWAVEQTVELIKCCHESGIGLLSDSGMPVSVMGLFNAVFDFVSKDAIVKVDLGQ